MVCFQSYVPPNPPGVDEVRGLFCLLTQSKPKTQRFGKVYGIIKH